ncbi:MAG: AmmeMemoRadiSam system protein B [Planctomycetes bacterium]|nr:AmmeMemoRadiSam system protein B [Planctomycetota bacterium]
MLRHPAVAGAFYDATKAGLEKTLKKLTEQVENKTTCLGVVSPHAGYIYSGPVAGKVFSAINIPDTVVILAPNHTGQGHAFSIWDQGKWQMPLGDVQVDAELCLLIEKESDVVVADASAHLREHSAEVQVPFLQYFNPGVRIAPVIIGSTDFDELKDFGVHLADAVRKHGKETLIVASSDMTHYETDTSARKKDNLAIAEILALDEGGLYDVVHKYGITMCGFAPTIAMLACVKALGAKEAKLIKYQTSGEVSGDYNQVVGYAGIVIA